MKIERNFIGIESLEKILYEVISSRIDKISYAAYYQGEANTSPSIVEIEGRKEACDVQFMLV
jgi:hypothetical protein